MDTVKVAVGNARMVAHRGCSYLEKENTMAAFVAAGNRSYYGIETDLHLTSDGQFILIHDFNTSRVCAESKIVEQTPFDELRALKLRDIDGAEGRADLHLPTLEEYLTVIRRYGKVGVLEIKAAFSVKDMDRVMDCVGDLRDQVVVISFFREALINLRAHHPRQTAQFLCDEADDALLDWLAENRFDIDIAYKGMNEPLLRKCKKMGIATNVWTVDDPARCERFAEMGVDYITSNCCEAK